MAADIRVASHRCGGPQTEVQIEGGNRLHPHAALAAGAGALIMAGAALGGIPAIASGAPARSEYAVDKRHRHPYSYTGGEPMAVALSDPKSRGTIKVVNDTLREGNADHHSSRVAESAGYIVAL